MSGVERANLLVTGASGQIGQAVCRLLQVHRRAFVATDVESDSGVLACDLRDHAAMARLLEKNSIGGVIHLASVLPTAFHKDPLTAVDVNLGGTFELLRQSVKYRVSRFVFASSMSVFGTSFDRRPYNENDPAVPADPYGAAKRVVEVIGDNLARSQSIEFVALRIARVVNRRSSAQALAQCLCKSTLRASCACDSATRDRASLSRDRRRAPRTAPVADRRRPPEIQRVREVDTGVDFGVMERSCGTPNSASTSGNSCASAPLPRRTSKNRDGCTSIVLLRAPARRARRSRSRIRPRGDFAHQRVGLRRDAKSTKRAAKRATRSTRAGSSANAAETWRSMRARNRPGRRTDRSGAVLGRAIALIVRSRRARSCSERHVRAELRELEAAVTAPLLRSVRASACSSWVSGGRKTGKSLPTGR